MSIKSTANYQPTHDLYSLDRALLVYADVNGFAASLGAAVGSPLFPTPRVEGAAVAGVRELGLQQFGHAFQLREALQSRGGHGFEESHLPQPFRGQRTQSCGGNIPESHTHRT